MDDASDTYIGSASLPSHLTSKILSSGRRRILSASRNRGIAAASGFHLFLVDDDHVHDPGTVQALVDFLHEHPGCGCAVPRPLYMDDSSRLSYKRSIDPLLSPPYRSVYGEVPPVRLELTLAPSALMIPRHVLERAGDFNEAEFPICLGKLELSYHGMKPLGLIAMLLPGTKTHPVKFGFTQRAKVEGHPRAFFSPQSRVALSRPRSKPFFFFQTVAVLPLFVPLHLHAWCRARDPGYFTSVMRGCVAGFGV